MGSRINSNIKKPVEANASQPQHDFNDSPDEPDMDNVCIFIFPYDLDEYSFDKKSRLI